MTAEIGEKIMSKKRLVDVKKFPGAAISDMYYHPIPLLENKVVHVTLHVGTNEEVNYEEMEIVGKLLRLKTFIQEKLPTTNVILLNPIIRNENVRTSVRSL